MTSEDSQGTTRGHQSVGRRFARILRHRRARRVIGVLASVAIIGVCFAFVLPSVARYGRVWERLEHLSPTWIGLLVLATVVNIVTFAYPWMVVIPRLTFLAALRVTQASTALITVVPGGAPMGMAISFGMLRSLDISRRDAGFAVALTGVWNQITIFLFPVVGIALIAGEGNLPGPLEWLAVVGVALAVVIAAALAAALASANGARSLGDLLSRLLTRLRRTVGLPPLHWHGDMLVSLRTEALVLLTQRWLALSVSTLANQLTGYLMLDLSLRAVGISLSEISIAETFAAWSIGRLIGSLPITPGGIGVVELGLVGTLVGFGGHDTTVVAGVLLYRFLIVVPTVVLGAIAGLTWKLGH